MSARLVLSLFLSMMAIGIVGSVNTAYANDSDMFSKVSKVKPCDGDEIDDCGDLDTEE